MKRKISHVKILWSGIILWIVSAIIRVIVPLCGYEMPGQEPLLDDLADRFPVVFLMLSVCIVAPILEEFLFRYWTKSRKRIITLGLFALMGGYVALSTFWWLGVGGFLLCTSLDYLLRDRNDTRTVALMLATSMVFALAHITEFSAFNIDAILCLTELFSLGLVACWLVYNLGFWWACLLHALNNTVAILIVILMPTTPSYKITSTDFDTPLYSASLRPLPNETISFTEINDSTVAIRGNLPVIALNLAKKFNPDIISGAYSHTEFFRIQLAHKEEPCWEYTLTFHDTIPYHNASWLLTDLANHSPLQIDTTYGNMFVIGIEDQQKVNETNGAENSTMMGLADDIRIMYDCPVVLEIGTNEYFPIKYDLDLFPYPYDIETLPNILSEKLGLFLYKSNVHKIQVITFSDDSRKR